MKEGVLFSWKGTFGFFKVIGGGPDIFVHGRSFEDSGCVPLTGRHYRFDTEALTTGPNAGKPRAVRISRIDDRGEETETKKALEIDSAWRSLPLLRPQRAGEGTS